MQPEPSPARVKPYVITVCHQKGGVAKTTTVVSLAAVLAADGHPTLVMDLDPSANLTASFGINPLKVNRSAADILLGNELIANVSVRTQVQGLELVPSNSDMVTVSRFLHLRPRYEHILQSYLSQNGMSAYEFVLVDCPPANTALTSTALTAANLAIIPIQCEYYAIQALDAMFKIIKTVRANPNPSLCYKLLVVMFDLRGSLHGRVMQLIQEKHAEALFKTVIGFDSKLRESQLAGVPITLLAPKTRATEQYQMLARELYAYVETKSLPQPA